MNDPVEWRRLEDIPAEIIHEYGSQIPWHQNDSSIVNWVVVLLGLATQQDVHEVLGSKLIVFDLAPYTARFPTKRFGYLPNLLSHPLLHAS